jgi:hypothetical protein
MTNVNLIEILLSLIGVITGGGSLLTLRIMSARHDVRLAHVEEQLDDLRKEFRALKEEFLRTSGGFRQRE